MEKHVHVIFCYCKNFNVSIQMLERVGESDHVPTVCVVGRWVTLILPTPYCTHHRCMCMYIVQREHIYLCG